jgi:hypothetical protein
VPEPEVRHRHQVEELAVEFQVVLRVLASHAAELAPRPHRPFLARVDGCLPLLLLGSLEQVQERGQVCIDAMDLVALGIGTEGVSRLVVHPTIVWGPGAHLLVFAVVSLPALQRGNLAEQDSYRLGGGVVWLFGS